MVEPVSILVLMDLLTGWFGGPSWGAWKVLLAALYALPMSEEQVRTYQRFTGRTAAPTRPATEGWVVVGRRAGKSIVAALVALHAAVFRSYVGVLAPGERGLVMVVAADRRQARVVFRYICAFFERLPGLAPLVERRTQEALHLTNGISIEVHTASFRSTRGYTVVCFIGDEPSFWKDDLSANPASEILNAVRPAQATVPGAVRLMITTPYARRDLVWAAYSKHWGQDGDPIVIWAADTLSMNPTVDPGLIAEADEAVAWSEYGRDGEIRFRSDVEGYVSREVAALITVPGRVLLPPVADVDYIGFGDVAGGSGGDSFTWSFTHAEERAGRRIVVVDVCEERKPPFAPSEIVRECAGHCKVYGITTITGDRYAGSWPAEQFAKYGIR